MFVDSLLKCLSEITLTSESESKQTKLNVPRHRFSVGWLFSANRPAFATVCSSTFLFFATSLCLGFEPKPLTVLRTSGGREAGLRNKVATLKMLKPAVFLFRALRGPRAIGARMLAATVYKQQESCFNKRGNSDVQQIIIMRWLVDGCTGVNNMEFSCLKAQLDTEFVWINLFKRCLYCSWSKQCKYLNRKQLNRTLRIVPT